MHISPVCFIFKCLVLDLILLLSLPLISADDLTAYLTEKTKALGGEAGPPVPTRCLPSLEAGHARASLAVTQGPFPTTTPSPSTLSGSFYGNIPIITQRETVRKTPS